MAIPLRKPNELTKLEVAGSIVGKTLQYLRENITVGMTLNEIDAMGEAFIREHGAEPSFKGLYGFRPHGDTSSMTIGDLRENAAGLERDVMAGIEFMKKCAERTKRNKADHRRAVKYYTTLKPRNNALKDALLDAMDKVA